MIQMIAIAIAVTWLMTKCTMQHITSFASAIVMIGLPISMALLIYS